MDNFFFMDKDFLEFVAKYPMRNVVVHKKFFFSLDIFFTISIKGGELFLGLELWLRTNTYRTPYFHAFHECTGDY